MSVIPSGTGILILSSPSDDKPVQPTILCVDDDPIVLEMRTRTLKSQWYSTVAASDGRMALSLFNLMKPDLVVLDYDMPGMNGYEVAVQMRDRSPEVPMILLSAYITFPESVIACFDLYLTKGEDISVFLSHVDRLVNRT